MFGGGQHFIFRLLSPINLKILVLARFHFMLLNHIAGVFKLFCQPNPFDLNYLLEVPPEILSKYFNN